MDKHESREQPNNKPCSLPHNLEDDRIVTIEQAAMAWGYSTAHVRRMYRTGKLPKPNMIGARKKGYSVKTIKKIIDERLNRNI